MIHRTRTVSDAFSVDSRALDHSPFSSPFSYLVVPYVEEETPERRESRESRTIMAGHLQPNVIMREVGFYVCVYLCVSVSVKIP